MQATIELDETVVAKLVMEFVERDVISGDMVMVKNAHRLDSGGYVVEIEVDSAGD